MKKRSFIILISIIFLGIFSLPNFNIFNIAFANIADHQTNIIITPNPAKTNETVSLKTGNIPECNSSTAQCEWRWSGDVNKITTNKMNGQWTTSFSNSGSKHINVEVLVNDAGVTNGQWEKIAFGSADFVIIESEIIPTPTVTSSTTPTPTPLVTITPTPTNNPSNCPLNPHKINVIAIPETADINQQVSLKTGNIPECNSSTAQCEWRWSGDVNKITTNKMNGQWITAFSTTGTKNINVEVYVKDSSICGDNWIKVAYGNKTITIKDSGVIPTPTSTTTPTPTSTTTPNPTSTPTPTETTSGGSYWIGGGGTGYIITPTPTVLGTSTCNFANFPSALAQQTCWINARNGGICTLTTNDGFNVRLAILANSYIDDLRINISIHKLSDLTDPNTKIGDYQFAGQKIIQIIAQNENCQSVDLENLSTLTINYLNSDATGFDKNSLTIVNNPSAPSNWNLITTYRSSSLNSLSVFTAQFGYFGIMGTGEKKVLGVITTTPSKSQKISPAFIAWYNPVCVTEPENLNNFYTLASLFDKIKNFHLPWYWISLLFNILIILWLLWMYGGKKLLNKYRISTENVPPNSLKETINANRLNNETEFSPQNISPVSSPASINEDIINLPSPQNYPSLSQNNSSNKDINEDDDDEILRKLKEKLNPSI